MARRAFDLSVAGLILVLSSPIWLVAYVLVRLDSPGPGLYTAERIGRDGVPFTMYKFRTMRSDAFGAAITARDDARVTRVGGWLRAVKIDELPQLLNVLRGEMSLVGPRPESPEYVRGYTQEQRRVLGVRPGITSPATVHFREEEVLLEGLGGDIDDHYRNVILPAKLKLELGYLDDRSLWRDIGVLVSTVKAILRL